MNLKKSKPVTAHRRKRIEVRKSPCTFFSSQKCPSQMLKKRTPTDRQTIRAFIIRCGTNLLALELGRDFDSFILHPLGHSYNATGIG